MASGPQAAPYRDLDTLALFPARGSAASLSAQKPVLRDVHTLAITGSCPLSALLRLCISHIRGTDASPPSASGSTSERFALVIAPEAAKLPEQLLEERDIEFYAGPPTDETSALLGRVEIRYMRSEQLAYFLHTVHTAESEPASDKDSRIFPPTLVMLYAPSVLLPSPSTSASVRAPFGDTDEPPHMAQYASLVALFVDTFSHVVPDAQLCVFDPDAIEHTLDVLPQPAPPTSAQARRDWNSRSDEQYVARPKIKLDAVLAHFCDVVGIARFQGREKADTANFALTYHSASAIQEGETSWMASGYASTQGALARVQYCIDRVHSSDPSSNGTRVKVTSWTMYER